MKTGFRGTFVISWTQTDLDGTADPALDAVVSGAIWRWTGEAVRVDGPQGLLRLGEATGEADLRKRAAQMVRRLMAGAARPPERTAERSAVEPETTRDPGFVLTDGRESYFATIIDSGQTGPGQTGPRLLMFVDTVPPQDCELWVVRRTADLAPDLTRSDTSAGVICFTPGTLITTPQGRLPVETLRPGDQVQTKDNGAQQIMWIGSRRMSGARLYAMPHLRPIRIRSGALGVDVPDGDLIVSPQHRLLIRGPAAQALFNTAEVLVTAQDLLDDHTACIDLALREVTYIHLLLEQHHILWANGVETESFHPANTALDMLDEAQRRQLLALRPELAEDPQCYGDYARRNLSASEAAILRHDNRFGARASAG